MFLSFQIFLSIKRVKTTRNSLSMRLNHNASANLDTKFASKLATVSLLVNQLQYLNSYSIRTLFFIRTHTIFEKIWLLFFYLKNKKSCWSDFVQILLGMIIRVIAILDRNFSQIRLLSVEMVNKRNFAIVRILFVVNWCVAVSIECLKKHFDNISYIWW